MAGYDVMFGGRVTQGAATIAKIIWPALAYDYLHDVPFAPVAEEVKRPACDVATWIRMLMHAGVLNGRIETSYARLQRLRPTIVIVSSLCDVSLAPVRVYNLDNDCQRTVESAVVPVGRQPVLSLVQYETLCATWLRTDAGRRQISTQRLAELVAEDVKATPSAVKSRLGAMQSLGILEPPHGQRGRAEFKVFEVTYRTKDGTEIKGCLTGESN